MRPVTLSEYNDGIRKIHQRIDEGISTLSHKLDIVIELLSRQGVNLNGTPINLAGPSSPPEPPLSALPYPLVSATAIQPTALTMATSASTPHDRVASSPHVAQQRAETGARCIPNLKREKGLPEWRWVLEDREHANTDRKLWVPLSKWPVEWYSGENRKLFGSKMSQRRWIALEYIESCGRNDATFYGRYPWADEKGSIGRLIEEIKKNHPDEVKTRRSKNGTVEERKSRGP